MPCARGGATKGSPSGVAPSQKPEHHLGQSLPHRSDRRNPDLHSAKGCSAAPTQEPGLPLGQGLQRNVATGRDPSPEHAKAWITTLQCQGGSSNGVRNKQAASASLTLASRGFPKGSRSPATTAWNR